MLTVNEVKILGYLGDNPEIRTTSKNADTRKIARFSVATTERWTDKETGEVKERTEWHKIVAFGKPAEVVEKYLSKGSLVLISGKLSTDKWQDDNGTDHYSTSIVVQGNKGIILLDKPEAQQEEADKEEGLAA